MLLKKKNAPVEETYSDVDFDDAISYVDDPNIPPPNDSSDEDTEKLEHPTRLLYRDNKDGKVVINIGNLFRSK